MGNYYNFYAATAGSGTSTFVGEAPDSICPKGWRMVGNEGEINGKEEKSWINLFSKYYGETHPVPYPGIEDSNADTVVLLSSFTFLRSGNYDWNDGGLYDRAGAGLYWSILAYASPYAHSLAFVPTWLNYQNGYYKGYGFSLR